MDPSRPYCAYRLRQFDESNPSKITSQAVTPRSVVGIGGKGTHLALWLTWNLFTIQDALIYSGEAGLL